MGADARVVVEERRLAGAAREAPSRPAFCPPHQPRPERATTPHSSALAGRGQRDHQRSGGVGLTVVVGHLCGRAVVSESCLLAQAHGKPEARASSGLGPPRGVARGSSMPEEGGSLAGRLAASDRGDVSFRRSLSALPEFLLPSAPSVRAGRAGDGRSLRASEEAPAAREGPL